MVKEISADVLKVFVGFMDEIVEVLVLVVEVEIISVFVLRVVGVIVPKVVAWIVVGLI